MHLLKKAVAAAAILAATAVAVPSASQQEPDAGYTSSLDTDVLAGVVEAYLAGFVPETGALGNESRPLPENGADVGFSSEAGKVSYEAAEGSRRRPASVETQDDFDLVCVYTTGFPAIAQFANTEIPALCFGSALCSDDMIYMVGCPAINGGTACPRPKYCGGGSVNHGLQLKVDVPMAVRPDDYFSSDNYRYR